MTQPRPSAPSAITLHGRDGRRKYLTTSERRRFIEQAQQCPRQKLATLCLLIAYTGCRISEALALRPTSFDHDEGVVTIVSLKKRGRLAVREIPVPLSLCALVAEVHRDVPAEARLWTWSRSRAWYLIKQMMFAAGIAPGPHATIKGLRHAFGIHAITCGVPLNLVQRWLGHASLATTAIYANALGAEERKIAERMWE